MTLDWIASADRLSPWREATVVVAGLGTSGYAAAEGERVGLRIDPRGVLAFPRIVDISPVHSTGA